MQKNIKNIKKHKKTQNHKKNVDKSTKMQKPFAPVISTFVLIYDYVGGWWGSLTPLQMIL